MSLGIVMTDAPGVGRARLGKLVSHEGRGIYVFDNATPYWKLDAFGVALCVLVEMLKFNYQSIHYSWNGRTYVATIADVLRYGIDDPLNVRPGYVYLPLTHWQKIPTPKYGFIPDSARVPLEWLKSSPHITRLRAEARARVAEAARPAAVQMGMFAAMGA